MTTHNWHARAKAADLSIRNFIDGQYEDTAGNNIISKHSPRDGELLYSFRDGDSSLVNRAVVNARQAFEDGRWSELPAQQRKSVLQKLADLIEVHKEEFALYESLDVGKPIVNALNADIPRSASRIRGAAEGAVQLLSPSGMDVSNFAYQLRKPVGVVAAIIGWNFPLSLATTKVGPALAMGNSLVLKPSEFTSLSASRLAELAIEAGVPPGVLNVVHGSGVAVGDALARHPDIDLLGFIGSSATGKKLMQAAGQSNMKRLILECGGKSPYIVFDDCPDDLDAIAANIVSTAFTNQGAVCVAGTRVLIQKSLKEKLLPKIVARTKKLIPQDPLESSSTFGALVNEAHMQKVLGYIESGKQEGANLILGGKRVLEASGGYYVEPTIFDNVDPQQKIAQEEIFGPVLSVFSFKDEEDAIKLANNTCFGLAAYAATENLGRAQRLGKKLNAGMVMIRGTSTPSGGGVNISIEGQRESGFGPMGGLAGLAAYTVSSAVHLLT